MARSVLTSQSVSFPRWYQDVVAKAELAENGPVRGTMVIRPYGYAIWERIVAEADGRIKAAGAENASFPVLIPESYFAREAEHVEGFRRGSTFVPLSGQLFDCAGKCRLEAQVGVTTIRTMPS